MVFMKQRREHDGICLRHQRSRSTTDCQGFTSSPRRYLEQVKPRNSWHTQADVVSDVKIGPKQLSHNNFGFGQCPRLEKESSLLLRKSASTGIWLNAGVLIHVFFGKVSAAFILLKEFKNLRYFLASPDYHMKHCRKRSYFPIISQLCVINCCLQAKS